jgi:hypothetical protein
VSHSRQRLDADSSEHIVSSYDDLALRTERLNLSENTNARYAAGRINSQQYCPSVQNGGCLVTTRALVEDRHYGPIHQEPISPNGYSLYRYPNNYMVPSARHCTCESRRSSDSGLADVSGHVDPCPLSPLLNKGSLLSVSSRPNSLGYIGSPRLSRRQSSSIGGRRLGFTPTVSGPMIFASPESTPFYSTVSRNHYPSQKSFGSEREDFSFPNSPSTPCDELQRHSKNENLSIQGQELSERLQAPAPLYRCSCGQEIPWGAMPSTDYARLDKVPQQKPDTNQAISSSLVKYSASMDDLAMCKQDADRFLTASLDQALSCSDLPATSGEAGHVIASETSQHKTGYFSSPPLVRHTTQQTLFQSQMESSELSRESLSSSAAAARSSWQRTKETYKTGLYAHWWLNASLQPIWEETLDPSPHPALDTETSL